MAEEGNALHGEEEGSAWPREEEGNAWLNGGVHDRSDIHDQAPIHKHRHQFYMGRDKSILYRLELDSDDDGRVGRT